MWVELILGFVGCLWLLDLVITKLKGDEPTVKRLPTKEEKEGETPLKDDTNKDVLSQEDNEDAAEKKTEFSPAGEIIEEAEVIPANMEMENSPVYYADTPAPKSNVQSLDCDMLNECIDDMAGPNNTTEEIVPTTEDIVAACMEFDVTDLQGAPAEQTCYEETYVQEEIVPVHVDHPSEEEENIADQTSYDDSYVLEEIVPLHVDHPSEDENQAGDTMELPCYEESAVEEQIVPVYMDHPSEDSNEESNNQEEMVDEVITPVYLQHPKEDSENGTAEGVNKDWSILGDCLEENIPFTKENDARMEDDGIVKEEIIPVHLQHTNKGVDDNVDTTELPSNEKSAVEEQIVPESAVEEKIVPESAVEEKIEPESAVEEQLVLMDPPRPPKPVFMDPPNEEINEGNNINETVHEKEVEEDESDIGRSIRKYSEQVRAPNVEQTGGNKNESIREEIVMEEESTPVHSEQTKEEADVDQKDDTASKVKTGYGKVEINLKPAVEEHTSSVPVPKKTRKKYTGARREYLPMKDGLPIGVSNRISPVPVRDGFGAATSAKDESSKTAPGPTSIENHSLPAAESKKKATQKNKDGPSSRIPLPSSIPITSQAATDETAPDSRSIDSQIIDSQIAQAQKAKSKRRRKKKSSSKPAANELSNRWPHAT